MEGEIINGKFIRKKDERIIYPVEFFNNKQLEEVVLHDGVEFIGCEAFKGCGNLRKINIPNGVKRIVKGAFERCEKLKDISLPISLTSIESNVFKETGIEQITIPEGVQDIGPSAFERCYFLENVTFPNSLVQISECAFSDCVSLTSIDLLNANNIGTEAFSGCKSLEKAKLPLGLNEIGARAFNKCENLQSIEIPESVNNIGIGAFGKCYSLKSVKLPENLSEIESEVFFECHQLNSVTIPDKVEQIGDYAFYNCADLKEVDFGKNLQRLNKYAFNICRGLTNLKMPNNLKIIDGNCFEYCENLQSVVLNDNLVRIGRKAFKNCESLKNINLPDSINIIDYGAFGNCHALEEIKLPKSLEVVSAQLFKNCQNLKRVEFNENITVIQADAFNFCKGLEQVKLPSSLKVLGSQAFCNCENLKVVEMSSDIDTVMKNVFHGCPNLKTVIIDGKCLELTEDMLLNFDKIYNFLAYAVKNNKFIPKNVSIMAETNPQEIEQFYKNSKLWKDVLSGYLNEWKPIFEKGSKDELNIAICNLYQISTALGLFVDGEDGKRAKEFLNNVTLKMCPQTLHSLYGSMNTRENGYNKEFAEFYIKNYKGKNEKGLHFLENIEYDWDEEKIVNYTGNAYNNWNKIKEVYPNKTILAHREQGSDNNNLTQEDVFNALNMTYYDKVDEGNEEMAEIVGRYGYSQEEFEELQKWYNEGKQIEEKDFILSVKEDQNTDGVVYELLSKTNPEALILGEKTNCCQVVNDAGSSCVEYGVTKPNSGFVKFCIDGKICGQSWVWYNEKTGIVCLDNIEVPTIWKKEMHKKEFQTSFLDCVCRLANGFKEQMEKNGHEVKGVTIGSGYNDLVGINLFKKMNTNRSVLPEDYSAYSDAVNWWYVVPTSIKTALKDDGLSL